MYSDFISLVERDALGVEPMQMRRLHADALDAAEAVMEADLLRIRHVVASVPLGVGKLEGEKLSGRPAAVGHGASSAVPAVVAAQLDAQRGAARAMPPVPGIAAPTARAPVAAGAGGGPVTPPAGAARAAPPSHGAASLPGPGSGSSLGLGLGMAVDMSALGGGAGASAAMSFADLSSGSAMRSDR